MSGLELSAAAPAADNVATIPAPPDVSKLEGEAETRHFAEALRAEKEGASLDAGGPVETEEESQAKADSETAKGKAKSAKPSKEFDSAKVLELLKAGKLEEVAKEAGIDLRVTSKDWAAFRNEEARSKHKLKEREGALAKRESELSSIVNTTKQSAANIIKAAEHVKNRDWVALLETAAPGEKVEDILREITDNALDPSTRKMRKLESEREQEKREAAELRAKEAERQATAQREQTLAGYRNAIAQRLASNEALGVARHKDDETFSVIVGQVLDWQLANAHKYEHLEQTEAEKQADADALAHIRNTIKSQAARWTKWLDDAASTETSDDQSGVQSATTQGAHGASKSVVRSISKAQGTGSTQSRKLTEDEEIVETARLLRQERLAARR
jgi:hypothetical protein